MENDSQNDIFKMDQEDENCNVLQITSQVLIIDDEPFNRMALDSMLSQIGIASD